MISNRILYMESLINDILEYTKVSTKNIEYIEFNIEGLIKNIVKNIDIENKIQLITNDLNLEIFSSKIALLQVFQNLITNSKKFSDTDKVVIEINFSQDNDFYYFLYKDNGPGISEKYREKVFELFETLNKNSTGIGLATVKSTIERLGGFINIQSREDKQKGVCFSFSIQKKKQTN